MRTIRIIMIVAILMLCASLASSSTAAVYDVVKLGAIPDGKTDCTNSFLKAWTSACSSSSAATIYVPPGRYLVQQMMFSGQKCKSTAGRITFRIDGTLVAPSDYRVLGSVGKWIEFDSVKTGVSINGGTFDGQGASLWACKLAGTKACPESIGATSLLFTNSKDIIINRVRLINSQMFHIVINGCQNVNIQGVTVTAAGNSPNTDGIHVQSSTNVVIIGADIKTGDDCISIGPGTSNLWIQQISCGPGHGISIGSLGKGLNEPGVQNVTVKTATFTGTENGFRIKTWGRPSNGFVQGVLFEDATMNNVQNPIIIDQNYCPHEEDCPDQVSGVTISEVRYKDIRGSSATRVAVKFDCSKKRRCRGITLENVKLSFGNEPAMSSCINADGTASGLVQPASCLL